MKTFSFPLDRFQFDMVSSKFRNKADIIRFWMNAIKIMTAYAEPQETSVVGELRVHVDKMNRLFLASDDKCISVNFPFATVEQDGARQFASKACGVIDSRMSSNIISLLAENILTAEEILEFAEPILEICEFDQRTWGLLRDLIIADDGYLRFDHDPARQDGKLHPINHIDFFYTQSSTFKIGILNKLRTGDLIDILDSRSDCHYLAKT